MFNNPGSLIMISSYPEKNSEPAKLNAVACYGQNLLSRYKSRKIVVLSEITGKGEAYKKGNVLVIPCWKPADPLLFIKILQVILKFDKVRDILIQFEFNMLGSFIHSSLIPVFILFLRLIGKKVTITQHQVVNDLTELSGHLNINKNTIKASFLNFGLRSYYLLLGLTANAIIVHEQLLKDNLSKWVRKNKIFVVSHGLSIENCKASKQKVRQELGLKSDDFVLLIFGYIAWYKGVDWLIKKVVEISGKYPDKKIKLIVAGGPSATLQSKLHYRKFLARVNDMINKNKSYILATGFVAEDKVYKYFKASDLVILPYRAMISASGPLSFALRFNKPFLLSFALKDSLRNPDFSSAIEKTGINPDEVIFSLKGRDFQDKIFSFIENKNKLTKLNRLSAYLRILRSWENIVIDYQQVITSAIGEPAFVYFKKAFSRILYKPLSLVLNFGRNN